MNIKEAADKFGVKVELMMVILAGLEDEFGGNTIDEEDGGGILALGVADRLEELFT